MKIISLFLILSLAAGSLFAQVKIACVGNSITEGWRENPSYVPPLQKFLGANFIVENDGRSGATVLKKGNIPYWTQSAFSRALKSNADIITIMLGTNDTKSKNWDSYGSEFKADYAALIDTLQSANKNAQILPVLPVPVCRENYGIRNDILNLVISIIKEIANEKGLTTIDANTPLLSFCDNFPDGVHPNAAGADTIASVLCRSISQVQSSLGTGMIETPSRFLRHNNFPNPFNVSTQIEYTLGKNSNVEIYVSNILGHRVATLMKAHQNGGKHSVILNASELPSGVYLCQIKTDEFMSCNKMNLIR